MKITILGCGSAPGVPGVSAGWGVCDPTNPKNRRRRASVLVEQGPTTILIDASPDLREQMLDAKVRKLDAVLFTHGHADHIHGLDELREINRILKAPIPIFADADTLRDLETRFGYAFLGIPPGQPFFRPWLSPTVIDTAAGFAIADIPARAFPQDHGYSTTLGYRIGDFAYSTDVLELSDDVLESLKGVPVWVVGALQDQPHATHAHLDKVLDWIERVKPGRAVLTHMSHALDYETLRAQLPARVVPAFDGMEIEV